MSIQLKMIPEEGKLKICADDTVAPPEMSQSCSGEADNGNATVKFNDLCDFLIDKIVCDLGLEDLANISDTSTRFRAIAGAVFSRKHAGRQISMDTCNYTHNLRDAFHEALYRRIPPYTELDEFLCITDAKVWFKLLRNFGSFIRHVRIHSRNYKNESYIPRGVQHLVKYVSNFCVDSLETLDVDGYPVFILQKPLTKLKQFCFNAKRFEASEAITFMPNLQTLKLIHFPGTIVKSYEKLKRLHLQLHSDADVHTFTSFLHLNPQIKCLRLQIMNECSSTSNDHIYESIAKHLTQLKSFKLCVMNDPDEVTLHRFESVESFSINYGFQRIRFEFNDLKKLTLHWVNAIPSFCMQFAQLNKKLKILKLSELYTTFLVDTVIQNLLNELPELEEIIAYSHSKKRYAILKNLLGPEWEQFQKAKNEKFKASWEHRFRHFRKMGTTRQLKLN